MHMMVTKEIIRRRAVVHSRQSVILLLLLQFIAVRCLIL